MKGINYFDEIVSHSFGLSIYTLFRNIKSYNENMSFEEHKEAFFEVLRHLLTIKKILFVAPGADIYRTQKRVPKFTIFNKEAQWDISPEEVIECFRKRWPSEINDSDSVELIYVLFEFPEMVWVDDNGNLYLSN